MTGSYGPFSSNIWFPVQSGTTTLPAAPTPVVNIDWRPTNAADIPVDWVPGDVETLFQEILPNQQDPVYNIALDTDNLIKPYKEVFIVESAVKVGLQVESFPYALLLENREVSLSVKARLSEVRTFPTSVVLRVGSNVDSQAVLQPWREARPTVKVVSIASSTGVSAPPIVLLHMDGLDGSTDFVDETGTTWTSSLARITYAEQKIGVSVGEFTVPTASLSASDPKLEIKAVDFTVEFWLKPLSWQYSTRFIYSCGLDPGGMQTDYGLYLNYRSLVLCFRFGVDYTYTNTFTVGELPNQLQWNHVAISRRNGTVRCYINGQYAGGGLLGLPALFATNEWIIGNSLSGQFFSGYIDEFRVIKGFGLYAENFTPPSEPYDPAPSLKVARLTVKTKAFGELIYINRASETTLKITVDTFFTTGSKFKPTRYAGNGSSRVVNGLGFRPSFVWIKPRSYDEYGLFAFDKLRGPNVGVHFPGGYRSTDYPTQTLTSFTQDGFNIGSSIIVNRNGYEFCAWVFGGNEARRFIAKSTVPDGFIAKTTMALVEPDAISYGFYESNNSSNLVSGTGSYVYHGFSSEPEAIFVARGTGNYPVDCRLVGKMLGARAFSQVTYNNMVQTSSVGQSIYQWNPSRPEYFRAGGDLDREVGTQYTFYAFKSKPGLVAIAKYGGSATVDTRVELGWRPAMVMIKELYNANGYSGAPMNVFDSSRPWNEVISWGRYTSAAATTPLMVDSTGFTIPKNSSSSMAGSLYMYIAVAGSLVSPLQVSEVKPDTKTIAIGSINPSVELVSNTLVEVPSSLVATISTENVEVTTDTVTSIPSSSILTQALAPDLFTNTEIEIPVISVELQTVTPDTIGKLETITEVPSSEVSVQAHAPSISLVAELGGLYLFPSNPLFLFEEYE